MCQKTEDPTAWSVPDRMTARLLTIKEDVMSRTTLSAVFRVVAALFVLTSAGSYSAYHGAHVADSDSREPVLPR